MSYLKLTLSVLLGGIIIGCGTEPEVKERTFEWESLGLVEEKVNAIYYSDSILYVASTDKILTSDQSKDFLIWQDLGLEIDTSNSEFNDVIVHDGVIFSVVRNTIGYFELPEDYITLYKSSNKGIYWEAVEITLLGQEKPFVLSRINNNSIKNLYADGGYIFKSENGGGEWTSLGDGSAPGNQEFLYISKNYPNQIWTGGWTNLFSPALAKSVDGGNEVLPNC